MAYDKQDWVDNDPTTPLSADRMDHIEDGIGDVTDLAEVMAADSVIVPYADSPNVVYCLGPAPAGKTKYGNLSTYANLVRSQTASLAARATSVEAKFPNGPDSALDAGFYGTYTIQGPVDTTLWLQAPQSLLYLDRSGIPSKILVTGMEYLEIVRLGTLYNSWTGGPAQVTLNYVGGAIVALVENAPGEGSFNHDIDYSNTYFTALDVPQIAAITTNTTLEKGTANSIRLGPSVNHQGTRLTLLGYGDYDRDVGPLDVIGFNPKAPKSSLEFVVLYSGWDTEKINHWREFDVDDMGLTVWSPSIDPRGSNPASLMTNWTEDGSFQRLEVDLPGKRIVHLWDVVNPEVNVLYVVGTRDLTPAEKTAAAYADQTADTSCSVVWKAVLDPDTHTITSLTEELVDIPVEPTGFARALYFGSASDPIQGRGPFVLHSMQVDIRLIDDGEGENPYTFGQYWAKSPGQPFRLRTMPKPQLFLANSYAQYPSVGAGSLVSMSNDGGSQMWQFGSHSDGGVVVTTYEFHRANYTNATIVAYDPLLSRFIYVTTHGVVMYDSPSGGASAIGWPSLPPNGGVYSAADYGLDENTYRQITMCSDGFTVFRNGVYYDKAPQISPVAETA